MKAAGWWLDSEAFDRAIQLLRNYRYRQERRERGERRRRKRATPERRNQGWQKAPLAGQT